MTFLYIVALLAVMQGILSLVDGYRAARHMREFRPRSVRDDRVVVMCPCKGVEEGFEKNVRSLLEQDYKNYEVRFVVEAETDPAYAALARIGVGDVLVAGRAANQGQKVHNLAYVVTSLIPSPGEEIYVFCDSDARYPRYWLSTLISPLPLGEGGAPPARRVREPIPPTVSTGYRWYVADRFHLPTLFRSAWNASVVSFLGDHDRNFAWGGSTAIRRETFDRLHILDAWRGALSDDYAITRAAQRARVPIVFVPECLVPSYGECTWRELLEFTTRQIIITRVYHPALWRTAFAGSIIFNAAFWPMFFLRPELTGVLFILGMWKASVRLLAVQTVLPDEALLKFFWFYILSPPFAALIYLYNMVRSALGTDIVWRQKHYKLISPNETVILNDGVGGSGGNEG